MTQNRRSNRRRTKVSVYTGTGVFDSNDLYRFTISLYLHLSILIDFSVEITLELFISSAT